MKGANDLFSINLQSREPIYEQVYNNVIKLISLGVLEPDHQLPPVRQMAAQLGVNPNTVSKAYKNLEQDGIIYSVVGRGSFVMPQLTMANSKKLEAINKAVDSIRNAMNIGVKKQEILQLVDDIYGKGVVSK